VEEKKLLSTKLDAGIYKNSKLPVKRSSVIIFSLFLITFLLNFPLKLIIKNQIAGQLAKMRTCPIAYKDIEVSFFLPKITIIKPVISGICFQSPGRSISLSDLPLSLSFPSFSPPGIRLYTKIKKGKTQFEIYPTLSYATHKIRIKDSIIDTSIIADFNNGNRILKGELNLNAFAVIRKNKLATGDLLITSKNLKLPSQSFGFFKLPKAITLGALQIKAKMDSAGVLDISDSFLGGLASPFAIKISGKVFLNQARPRDSKLELKGGIKFSKQFLEDYAILSLFLNLDGKQANTEGFFDLRIEGTIGAPKPKVL